jgi:hypothetical protein
VGITGYNYILTCISHRRPQNIKKIYETSGTDNIVFFVNDQIDVDDYKVNGAEKIYKGGNLIGNRNAALDYCFNKNKICVQIDDDLQTISINDFTGKRTKKYVTVVQAIKGLLPQFINSKYNYAGAPPTANPFFATKVYQENILITAPFTITKPNPIRFDTRLKLKEDYDYTLQHIQNTGCIRYHKYLFDFKRYGNKGGVVSYRTDKLEQKAINYLQGKWGECIKLNPKRQNEILLNKNSEQILKQNINQIKIF